MKPMLSPVSEADPHSLAGQLWHLLLDHLPEPLLVKDMAGRYILANKAAAAVLGVDTPQALIGKTDFELASLERAVLLQGHEIPLKDAAGNAIGVACLLRKVLDAQGSPDQPGADRGSGTRQQQAMWIDLEASLERERALLRTIIDSIPAKIYAKDNQSRFIACNRLVARDMGTTAEKAIGRTDFDFFPRSMAEGFYKDEQSVIASGRALIEREELVLDQVTGTMRQVSTSKMPLRDSDGHVVGIVGIGWDITERKRAEERVRYLATHDSLTGLPNRSSFSDTLHGALISSRHQGSRFAVLFVDLDRFKFINDTLGHEAGDALLKQAADRLQECVHPEDTVARLGGDEFVLLCRNPQELDNIGAVASRVLHALSRPLVLMGQECRVSASIGVSMYPLDGDTERALMKSADTAMYTAKQEGKNNFRLFTASLRNESLERTMLENELRRAIESDELLVHYLPKFDLHSRAITGAEALLRWAHPRLGLIPPAKFLSMAEETGLIIPIGVWVLNTVCAQQMAWQREGLPAMCISVNLTARQFNDESLLSHIRAALGASGMSASMLELELSEPLLMRDTDHTCKVLDALKKAGVRLAIDNFGASYLSLSSIRKFPIDTLKVDRALLRDIAEPEARAIADAIIEVGKSLSLTVIAEGVETTHQATFAREHACDAMQGFYVSEPAPAADFGALLRQEATLRQAQR